MRTVSASWTTTLWYERKRLFPILLKHLSALLCSGLKRPELSGHGMVPSLNSAPAVLPFSLDKVQKHQDLTLQISTTTGSSFPGKGPLCLEETGMEFP